MAVGAPPLPIATVLHPTDLSLASEMAFAHALRIALAAGAELTIFHADRGGGPTSRGELPGVRATLERWGLIPDGSARSALAELGLRVEKIRARGARPLEAIDDYFAEKPPQLVALASEGGDGAPRWLHRRVAEPIARKARAMTLFVRPGARGFVEPESGRPVLRRVLIPVTRAPRPEPAVSAAAALARAFEMERVTFALCRVGGADEGTAVPPPERPGWEWRTLEPRRGRLGPGLLSAAAEFDPDLIAMTTRERRGVRDTLFGPAARQLVRRAPCSLLAIPGS